MVQNLPLIDLFNDQKERLREGRRKKGVEFFFLDINFPNFSTITMKYNNIKIDKYQCFFKENNCIVQIDFRFIQYDLWRYLENYNGKENSVKKKKEKIITFAYIINTLQLNS